MVSHRRRQANPHDILRLQNVEPLTNYLVREIQDVYRLQGITIHDKHIEVIARQMLRKSRIKDNGDTELLRGEPPWLTCTQRINHRAAEGSKARRACSQCCWGSPKASLATESFLSAASFEKTTKVLTEAADAWPSWTCWRA